jgi:asparagine synthase (glutamine-hydrolysing)
MSGFAAAIHLRGGPAPLAHCEAMRRAAAHRAPDGCGTSVSSGGAFALLRRVVLPEQPSDEGPLVHGPSGLAFVFDGRIDNRDALARAFGWDGVERRAPDAAYGLEAFARWGASAAERIEGAFACAVWDARRRRVLAVRDRMGLRPLHWAVADGMALLASDAAQIVAALANFPDPDLSAVADLLAREPAADDRTLFRGIHRVPPGSAVAIDERGPTVSRYWTPEPRPMTGRRSDQQWAEACREVVERAVRARLRARGRAAVFFSGGIDSSAVLAVAHRLAARGSAMPVPVTLQFDEPESDERQYRDALTRALGCSLRVARPADVARRVFREQARRRLTVPDLPADLAGAPLRAVARDAGALVALTGVGGDALFSGSTLAYADLIGRGRVAAALARHALDWTMDDSGWTRAGLLTSGVWPLLGASVRRRLRPIARRAIGATGPEWLRLPRSDRPVVPDPPPGVSHAAWDLTCSLRDGWTSFFLESSERGAAEVGFEERHPLLDAAVVEFALSIPERQRRRGRTTKVVLRRSLPELPPLVARRRSKCDFSHLVLAALANLGGRRFFGELAIGQAGWVDPIALARRYDRLTLPRAAASPDGGRDVPALWIAAAVELWYRAAYDRTPAPAFGRPKGAVAR